jgi:CRISPR-associated protein Cmr4
MNTKPFLLHALSSLHAGTGHSPGIIDLPIARMKATGIPFVPGSSIKGVLREARSCDTEKVIAVFGPARDGQKDDGVDRAGALVVGDARLLALPVRSFKGTFAWVTSPLLLALAKRDVDWADLAIPRFESREARYATGCLCVQGNKVYLDDLDLNAKRAVESEAWAKRLAPLASPGDDIFTKRFLIVDDDTMTFLWETATQVDARVRLDAETRTVANGALWLEESLPAETLLIGLLGADRTRGSGETMTPAQVLDFALPGEQVHQFGGKATTGRGRCRIVPIQQNGGRHG